MRIGTSHGGRETSAAEEYRRSYAAADAQSGSSSVLLVFLFKVKRPEITESTHYCTHIGAYYRIVSTSCCHLCLCSWSARPPSVQQVKDKIREKERERERERKGLASKLMAYETSERKRRKKKQTKK